VQELFSLLFPPSFYDIQKAPAQSREAAVILRSSLLWKEARPPLSKVGIYVLRFKYG